ncbi:Putative sulfate transporter YbaR [Seminavis robusta]|uniref:Sulfate transporter YbaR n=1 Tax=Seminavis robusta TaxID=568900 RepID=A0A9N8DSH1_9STRA|nr:Putative sulfate transporter YbaR [Seminavis robusta]|eukprot:Sro320_g116440.1 Putative sulfate transporter YbaR (788) ;mRNA; f:12030-14545
MDAPNSSANNSTDKETAGSSKGTPTVTATGGGVPTEIPTRSHIQQQTYDSTDRDPFLAFIPKLFGFGARLVGHELGIAKRAVCGCPRWSVGFMKETFEYYKTNPKILYDEVISGFTVAIMQVPESIAFSFVAGVPPLSGLHATFWMATITGILGGKPGMISGAAGALAVVVADLTIDNGVLDYLPMDQRLNVLYMTMVWCGIAQIVFAWLRLAQVVRLIPETGLIGFMDALAIIIFMAQLPAFMKCDDEPLFVDCSLEQRQWLTFQDDTWVLILSLVQVGLCMAIMKFFPLIPKLGRIVPASLVGLLVGTLLEHTLFRRGFGVATRTVQETAQMSGSLPQFDWPVVPRDSKTIGIIAQYALTLAAIGGVESILTLQACHEITDTVPKMSDSNQELFAQGLANFVSGLFRAMGGDAMIGQSTINIMNGARHRVSSTMSGLFMLLFVIAISDFIELLPVSTLTGVLFMVVLSTFQWKTFEILRYGRLSDSGVIVLVTLIAVFFNLAVAIGAGIVFSALVHAWDSGSHVDADISYKPMSVKKSKGSASRNVSRNEENAESVDKNYVDDDEEEEEVVDVKYVHVKGSIFFGSARHFINFFNIASDPDTVVIDLKDALIIDHSAVAAIGGITHRFAKAGKRVLLVNVPHKSHGRLHRTGDHGILKQQIVTHPKELFDVENGAQPVEVEASVAKPNSGNVTTTESGDVIQDNTQDSPARQPAGGMQSIASGYQNDDGIEVQHTVPPHSYGGLNQLHLFDKPVVGVEEELDQLCNKSGRFEVHDIETEPKNKDA